MMDKKIEICDAEKCSGCGTCLNICPCDAISMRENEEGFLYPYIDESICINCNLCREKCVENSKPVKSNGDVYMGWHKEVEKVINSSSGGAFSAIADYVLKKGGIVFGASMNPKTWDVSQIEINNEEDLANIRLSKYHQSNAKMSFRRVRELVEQGRLVLYSGTACQIDGLYRFLNDDLKKKKYKNLITIDVLCHGCTSKKLVEYYINSKERKFKKKIDLFFYRTKCEKTGWNVGSPSPMRIRFNDGSEQMIDSIEDTFFSGFNHNLFLREACYQCQYAGINRVSDFTIADYWGVNETMVDAEQLKLGVSLILVNSDYARILMPSLESELVIRPANIDLAIQYNKALISPNERPIYRGIIFKDIEKNGFDGAVKKRLKKYYIRLYISKCFTSLFGEKKAQKVKASIKNILRLSNISA